MPTILKISKIFKMDDEFWYEARADGLMRLTFRAPPKAKFKIGDAIEFERNLADQDAVLPVYSLRGSSPIHIRSGDIVDLSDRSVKRELRFGRTVLKLIATGEVELSEVHQAGDLVGFDNVDDLEYHLNAVPDALPAPLRAWLLDSALPSLKKAG